MENFITAISGLILFILALRWLVKEATKSQPKDVSLPPSQTTIKIEEIEKPLPFRKKKYLMTPTEDRFYKVLLQIIQDKYFIMPQVLLSRIIEVQNGLSRYGSDSWYSNFSRINKKTVDFVIFNKQNFEPLLVIELDDHTHNYYSRRQRDKFLNEALKASQLNILHIKPQYSYNFGELEKNIFLLLQSQNGNENN